MNQSPGPTEPLGGLDHFRNALGDALIAHARSLPARAAPMSRSHHRPRVLLVGAMMATVLAVALITGLGTRPSSAPPAASAAEALRSAAGSVLTHPLPALGPHEYFFTDSVYTARGDDLGLSSRALFTERDEEWIARDGSGLSREQSSGPGTPLRARRLKPSPTPFSFGLTALSYRQLTMLPGEPDRLARALAAITARQQRQRHSQLLDGRAGRTYILFSTIRDAFEAPSPPRLRAALYELLARTPGLHLDGTMRDHAGQSGVAVSVLLGAVRFRMIIDQRSGELLESQRVLVRRSDQLGHSNPLGLFSRGTILNQGIVSRIGQRAHH